MIEREVEAFDRWTQSLEITPTIVSLRERWAGVAEREVERWRRRRGPLSAEHHREVEELVRALLQKILHRPVVHLRKSVDRGDIDSTAALYRQIFGLEQAGEPGADADTDEVQRELQPEDPEAGPRRLLKGGKEE